MITRMRLLTGAIACGGVALFYALDLPLPFLFGPMFACLFSALIGLPLQGAGQLSVAARTVLGVAIGASITPAILGAIPAMAITLAMIPAYVVLIGLIGVPFFHRLYGFDRVTSYYSAMPGGFQDMVIFGEEAGADIRALSLIQATRVLLVITLVPFLLAGPLEISLDQPIGLPAQEIPLNTLFVMVVTALLGWKIGVRLRLFGASILGPMILATGLSLLGVLDQRPPAEALLAAQFFIGMGIGTKFRGVTLAELRRSVLAGATFTLILGGLSVIFTLAAIHFARVPVLEAVLSFAPGGQAEMTLLALVTGANLGFIIAHHLLRIVIVIIGAPIIARLVIGKVKSRPE
jgi:uncharacterized protein